MVQLALLHGEVTEAFIRDAEVILPRGICGVAGGEAFENGVALGEDAQGPGQIALRHCEVAAEIQPKGARGIGAEGGLRGFFDETTAL